MENKYYKRNIVLAVIAVVILFILITVFTNNYLERNMTEVKPNVVKTEDLTEGIENIDHLEDDILLSELIEDGYNININGNRVTRITKSEEMYDMYAIDDDNKIVYVSYNEK